MPDGPGSGACHGYKSFTTNVGMVFHASHGDHPSLDLHQTWRAWLGVYCDRESDSSGVALIRHKRLRRVTGTGLVIAGAIFIWLAPDVPAGAILIAVGIALEIAGITLERRNDKPRDDRHAMEQ